MQFVAMKWDKKYLQIRSRYLQIKEECSRRVSKWRWATDEMIALRPFNFEIYRERPGRWLPCKPDDPYDKYRYGFDQRDRVVLVENISVWGRISEKFHWYDDAACWVAEFDDRDQKQLVSLHTYVWENDRLVRCEAVHNAKLVNDDELDLYPFIEYYTYDDLGRIIRRDCVGPERFCGAERAIYDIEYDERGRVDAIHYQFEYSGALSDRSRSGQVYKRPVKGESIRSLSNQLRVGLRDEILQRLRAANIEDAVYCLELVYDAEDECLPPMIALGKEADRVDLIAKHGRDAKYELWNPAEFDLFNIPELALTDETILDLCRRMAQRMLLNDTFQPAVTLLNKVAADLMEQNWAGILNTTDDFVVFAVDLEAQDDMMKNIRKSVSTEQRRQMRKMGVL